MTMMTDAYKVDGELVAQAIADAGEKLHGTEDEIVLDFSAVRRIDPAALRSLEDLAAAAEEKPVKMILRGVNVDIYKVLKLARLTARFTIVG